MLFNPLSLVESSNVELPISEPITSSYELKDVSRSFFAETTVFLSQMNNEFREANRIFYRDILESSDYTNTDQVILESYGDFFDTVKNIIDKFLEFIKNIFFKFVTMINKMIGSDKYILKHEARLREFSSIHNFDFMGYKFTIYEDIPTINAYAEFSDNFVFDIADGEGDFGTNTGFYVKSDIDSKLKELKRNLDDGNWYNYFRGRVINVDRPIYQEDFADELFEAFRDGDNSKNEITADSSYIHEAFARFKEAKKKIEKVKKLKSRIDSDYSKVKKSVEKMVTTTRNNGSTSSKLNGVGDTNITLKVEDATSMDMYIRAKTVQIQEMANIHALAFASKLDALTDSYKQDKAVLFKALDRVSMRKEI